MLNIGAGEVIVIALILLIAVGPEQLPGLIRRVGRTVAEVRGMTEGLRSEFMSGLDEIERATDPGAWAAAAGPSHVKRRTAATPEGDADDDPDDDLDASDDADDDVSEDADLDVSDDAGTDLSDDDGADSEVQDPEVPDNSGLNSFLKPHPTDDDEVEVPEEEEAGGEQ